LRGDCLLLEILIGISGIEQAIHTTTIKPAVTLQDDLILRCAYRTLLIKETLIQFTSRPTAPLSKENLQETNLERTSFSSDVEEISKTKDAVS
jgi:hypothetical protein